MSSYNPRNAFPRETTYVPQLPHHVQRNAVNGPHLGVFHGGGGGRLVSLAGAIDAKASGAASLARGSGSDAAIRALDARPSVVNEVFASGNQRRGLQRHNTKASMESQGRRLMGQGRPALPEVDRVSEAAGAVLGSDVSVTSSIWTPEARPRSTRERTSVFNEALLAPTNPVVSKVASSIRKNQKVIPGQLHLPGI